MALTVSEHGPDGMPSLWRDARSLDADGHRPWALRAGEDRRDPPRGIPGDATLRFEG